jgi:hypothetical protein
MTLAAPDRRATPGSHAWPSLATQLAAQPACATEQGSWLARGGGRRHALAGASFWPWISTSFVVKRRRRCGEQCELGPELRFSPESGRRRGMAEQWVPAATQARGQWLGVASLAPWAPWCPSAGRCGRRRGFVALSSSLPAVPATKRWRFYGGNTLLPESLPLRVPTWDSISTFKEFEAYQGALVIFLCSWSSFFS